jgi:hypothetical protein
MRSGHPATGGRALVAVVAAGILLRTALLPLPGTLDVSVWKIWAFAASTERVSRLYGVGGDPPERAALRYRGATTTVDYPPLSLEILGLVGQIYRAVRPAFPDGPALTMAIKAPIVLADAALAVWLYLFARRRRPDGALRTLTRWWLGPAVLLNGAALGYLDPLCALPAAGAFLAAASGSWLAAGALGAAAALVKAQGLIPLVALACLAVLHRQAGLRLLAGGSVVCAVVLAPILIEGTWPNFTFALSSLTRHNMVSGNATNLWWLYTWVFRALYSLDRGPWVAFTQPVRILQLSTVREYGHTSPKLWATLLVAAATAWACWRALRLLRRMSQDGVVAAAHGAALGSFLVHAYFTLGAQVHENHLFLAIPLAVVAALGVPEYRRVALVLSVVQALNLFLFYGISEGIGWRPPRNLTVVDSSVLLAGVAVVAFVWHLRVYAQTTRPLHALVTDRPTLATDAGRTSWT